jgi:hypothetical protein
LKTKPGAWKWEWKLEIVGALVAVQVRSMKTSKQELDTRSQTFTVVSKVAELRFPATWRSGSASAVEPKASIRSVLVQKSNGEMAIEISDDEVPGPGGA